MATVENIAGLEMESTGTIKKIMAQAELKIELLTSGNAQKIKSVIGTTEMREWEISKTFYNKVALKCEDILKERGVIEKTELDLLFI